MFEEWGLPSVGQYGPYRPLISLNIEMWRIVVFELEHKQEIIDLALSREHFLLQQNPVARNECYQQY